MIDFLLELATYTVAYNTNTCTNQKVADVGPSTVCDPVRVTGVEFPQGLGATSVQQTLSDVPDIHRLWETNINKIIN